MSDTNNMGVIGKFYFKISYTYGAEFRMRPYKKYLLEAIHSRQTSQTFPTNWNNAKYGIIRPKGRGFRKDLLFLDHEFVSKMVDIWL